MMETISSVVYFFLIILITVCFAFVLTACCFSSSCFFAACINACDGYFLFDMIHLKKADQWSYVKTGIDGVIKKD